ncbi:hypothetical protein IWW50_001928 [Coemansia erecta]|nr:hypothetical protein IWW50_001928 [Coemansia erecta]
MRRTINATTHKKCIAHIDIALYEDVFSSIVQEARSASGGRRAAGTNGVGQSAFDHVPEWVQDRPRTATAHERSANGAASRDVDDRTTESYDSTSSPNYQEIQQANGADAGNQAQASQRADANNSRSNTVAGAQGHTYPSINHAYGQPGLLTTAPQIPGSNVLLASPPLHPHVMPMPAASHYMTMPQMYSQIDPRVQHHMLMHPMYSGNGAYGANAPNMAGPAYQDMYSNKSLQEAISRVLEILQEPKKDM